MIQPLIDSGPAVTVGQFKTLGPCGPAYEIVGHARRGANDEWLVPIRVVVSGDQTEYRYDRLRLDPDAV